MERILILCPTRARPENVKRLRESLRETATGDTFDFVYLVDTDDPRLVDYLVDGQTKGNYFYTDKPKRLGPWLNHAVEIEFTKPYDIVAFLGDDVISRTRGWDKAIREAMVPNGIVYCNDGWQGERLPTGVFMDARMVEKAGYMVYPELVHLYIDNHWRAWGEALGTLTYLEDISMEHMHPFAGKGENDKVYTDANTPDLYLKDSEACANFVEKELPELVKRLG